MNWKQFKDAVESQGVTDDMKIWYIDIDYWIETNELDVDISDPKGGVMIT